MATTTLFLNNRSQAVRIPKSLAFPETVTEVEVIRIGESLLICPAGKRWDSFFARKRKVSDDFMAEREQGSDRDFSLDGSSRSRKHR